MKTTTNKTASVLRQLFGALLAVVLIVAPLGVSANTGKSITGQPPPTTTTPVTTTQTYTPTYTSSYTPSSSYSYASDDDFNYLDNSYDNSYNDSSITIPLNFSWTNTTNKTNNTNTIYNTGAGSSGSIYSTNNTTNSTSNSTKQQPYSYGDYRSPSVSYDYVDAPYTYGGYNGTYVTYDNADRPYSYNDYSGTRVHYDYTKKHNNNDDDDDDNNNNDDEPSCDIDASDTSIEEGDSVTLRWDVSGDATSASINNGVGSVDEDGGSKRVSPDEDTTYRLTVRNSKGSDTCSVTVNVGPDNQNNVSLNVTPVDTVGNQPYTSVYLADAPYTGSGDMVTIVGSIIALVAGALALGYVLFMKGLPFAFKRATVNNAPLVAAAPKKSEAKAIRVGGIDQNEVYAFMNAYAVNDTHTMQSIRAEIKARGVDESRLAHRVSSAASDALIARKFGGATENALLAIDLATLETLAA